MLLCDSFFFNLLHMLCSCYISFAFFSKWLAVLAHEYNLLLLFFAFLIVILPSGKLALRVPPAVTRLTVYRWLHMTRRASAELPESNTDEDALGRTPHP